MGTTPNYALRYPEGADPPNVPADVKNLADDTDAQLAALSSTYDVALWVPAASLTGANTLGAPSLTNSPQRSTYWLFDANSIEGVFTFVVVPAAWDTMNIDFYWTNAGDGGGDVVWVPQTDYSADGEAMALPSGAPVTISAPVKDTLKVSRCVTGQTVSSPYFTLGVRREASSAADTLANDAGVFGVLLSRAS